jgi:hypothetical protein
MVKKGIGRVLCSGRANTRYISVPAAVVTDDDFPFDDQESVMVQIVGDRIVVEKIE